MVSPMSVAVTDMHVCKHMKTLLHVLGRTFNCALPLGVGLLLMWDHA
jgi:hypothetical protein